MIVTFFSIGCLIFLSFLTGFFTFFYISSQLKHKDNIKCNFQIEDKIGYRRSSINNNQLK